MITYRNTVLIVSDIRKSTEFYTEILNQEIEFDFESNVVFKSGISLWELRDYLPLTKMLGNERLKTSKSTKFELYFEAENLNEIENNLTEYGIHFLHHVHEEPWGQYTIRFFDPDEHLLEIGEPIEIFVTRFHKKGMSAEQISKRTSIPVNTIINITNGKSPEQ